MSGGAFSYKQDAIRHIIYGIEQIIQENDADGKDWCGQPYRDRYTAEEIAIFEEGLKALRIAYVYAQRIDWFVSCDDGPESFVRRLREELAGLDK
jgi:hypothetical protein